MLVLVLVLGLQRVLAGRFLVLLVVEILGARVLLVTIDFCMVVLVLFPPVDVLAYRPRAGFAPPAALTVARSLRGHSQDLLRQLVLRTQKPLHRLEHLVAERLNRGG